MDGGDAFVRVGYAVDGNVRSRYRLACHACEYEPWCGRGRVPLRGLERSGIPHLELWAARPHVVHRLLRLLELDDHVGAYRKYLEVYAGEKNERVYY